MGKRGEDGWGGGAYRRPLSIAVVVVAVKRWDVVKVLNQRDASRAGIGARNITRYVSNYNP